MYKNKILDETRSLDEATKVIRKFLNKDDFDDYEVIDSILISYYNCQNNTFIDMSNLEIKHRNYLDKLYKLWKINVKKKNLKKNISKVSIKKKKMF